MLTHKLKKQANMNKN